MEGRRVNSGQALPPSLFPTTHWSVVLGASERVEEAFKRLYEAYQRPVLVYLQASGHSLHDAQDFSQGFLMHLMRPGKLQNLAPEKGLFRAFLLTALKNHVRDERARDRAQRRGGGAEHVSVEADGLGRARQMVGAGLSPDEAFDRSWAEQVVERAMESLQAEAVANGREKLLAALLPILYRDEDREHYQELANRMGTTTEALRSARYRVVARLRRLVMEELKRTLPEDADVAEELAYLSQVLAGRSQSINQGA
ncbi:MAG: sigma-70 family RNA polymerase sigma factor [Verrucomicrobiales bacterium]|nr:sigma-70 family RNA polymerase sigma factor [Verrucomicrobiales bacterium]